MERNRRDAVREPKRDSEYYLPKREFYTVVNFCLSYDGWKMRLRVIDATIKKLNEKASFVSAVRVDGMPKGTNTSDPVGVEAQKTVDLIRTLERDRERVERKVNLIDEAIRECCEESLRPYIMAGITNEGATCNYLIAQGMPLNKNAYSEIRRKVYYYVSQRI